MTRSVYVRPTRAIVHRNTLRKNWEVLSGLLRPESKILAVVKANGYGHGSILLAKECEALGAVGVGVADVSEAIVLRQAGFTGTLLCLGALPKEALPEVAAHGLIASVYSEEVLSEVVTFAHREKKNVRVHIKVDTGMHRLGFLEQDWIQAIEKISKEPLIELEGIFTHLAESDAGNREFTESQLRKFEEAVCLFEGGLKKKLIRHASNSGGLLHHTSAHFDWVRPGIALYGYPSESAASGLLKPVLEWKAPVLQVKAISTGDSVGYDRAFRASRPMKIAVVAAGYGDGFRRSFALAGVGFRGHRIPILGKICMDLLMVDVSTIADAKAGEEVTLLGAKETGAADARELAKLDGTIPYEVLTGIHGRVTRVVC